MKIVIGIPAYNEEKNIGSIILKLKQKYDKIIVCDDGSTDMTYSISTALGAVVVKYKKNQGYGAAIRTIFDEFKKTDSDI